MQFGLKVRVGLTLSAIWICIVALTSTEYQSGTTTFGIAALPLVVLWGVGWTLNGWLDRRKSSKAASQATQPVDRKPAIKYAATLLAVFIVGVLFATWYADHRLQGQASPDIAFMVGQWSVYTLLAYAAFRFAPGFTRPIAGLLAAMFFVAGLNYSNYKQIELFDNTRQSLAASTPILLQIHAGRVVDEGEIKAANVGVLEPLVLAASRSANRVNLAQARYLKELAAAGVADALTPASLSTEGGRARSALIFTNAERITSEYLIEVESALKSSKANVRSAIAQMPKEFSSVLSEYDNQIDVALQQTQETRNIQNELLKCGRDIISLLNVSRGPLKISAGPQPQLLFPDQHTADAYNALISQFGELARREAQFNERVQRQRTEQVDRLNQSLDAMN